MERTQELPSLVEALQVAKHYPMTVITQIHTPILMTAVCLTLHVMSRRASYTALPK